MENGNSFDNLVSSISKEERKSMLDKMHSSAPAYDGDVFTPIEEITQDTDIPLSEQLKRESFFTRLFFWIKSIFTNTSTEILFNEEKISNMAKNLQRNFPGLIDAKRGLLLPLLYDKLIELKKSADFFKPYITSIEQDDGAFYVFLGSIIMPEVAEDMNSNADPYSNPISTEVRLDLRVELLHHMDDILQNIPADCKKNMYEAVKSIEWLRQFVKLPFFRFTNLFSEVTDSIHSCRFSQIENEIGIFAKLLCNGFILSESVVEALYLFTVRNSRRFSENHDDDDRCAIDFMTKARAHMAVLHMFMSSVPMHSISCIVYGDSQWQPDRFSGGEDWFVKFKTYWKKIFEQKWDAWVHDCKKEGLKEELNSYFELESYPVLPYRPWTKLWNGVKFRYELTSGFLFWYFMEKFPKSYELTLKNVMVEGMFKKKDNQTAFTDMFNELVQIALSLSKFNDRLKPTGDVGMTFDKIHSEKQLRTLQEQSKVEQLIKDIETDMQTIIYRFGDAVRSISMILAGILGTKKDARFDSLSNLSRIQGHSNVEFIKTLNESQQSLEHALNLVKELESIDSPQGFVALAD